MICLDVEGVLFPELRVILAQHFGIFELAHTTKDELTYADLMYSRIPSLDGNNIKYSEILKVLSHIEPLDRAANNMFAAPNLAEELSQLPRSNRYEKLLQKINKF